MGKNKAIGKIRDLIILGTGVHAAEMAEIIQRVNGVRPTWNFLGHVKSRDFVAGETFNDQPVLGTFEAVDRYPSALLVPENGFPRDLITVPRERLTSLVDPSKGVTWGRGVRFGKKSGWVRGVWWVWVRW